MSTTKQDYLTYTSLEGDRWDLIAYRFYGDIDQMTRIIEANPNMTLSEVLPTGTKLYIPIIAGLPPNNKDLPYWMR